MVVQHRLLQVSNAQPARLCRFVDLDVDVGLVEAFVGQRNVQLVSDRLDGHETVAQLHVELMVVGRDGEGEERPENNFGSEFTKVKLEVYVNLLPAVHLQLEL